MRGGLRFVLPALLFAAASAPAQDGGRDTGTEGRPLLFLRWRRIAESGRIYNAAWGALEPHFGLLSRRRLLDIDGDAERAALVFSGQSDAAAVVAFGEEAAARARAALPGAMVLAVGPGLTVDTRADRAQLAALLRLFRPGARRLALFGPEESLPGFEVRRCRTAEEARGSEIAWVSEGAEVRAAGLRAALDRERIPLVSTSDALEEGTAALVFRPHEESVGRLVASLALRWAREGVAPAAATVRRMRILLDLKAARSAGQTVPYALLARADAIRR